MNYHNKGFHKGSQYKHNSGKTTMPIQKSNIISPYKFCQRKGGKHEPKAFHHELLENHYDIAFQIEWSTLTPTAVNPCIDTKVGNSPHGCKEGEYAGYNKRWLMIDNRLAISPFTVKSAIANGFANIMGGCYRVNTKEEGHKDIGKGQYLYGGGYKRYRVAMNGWQFKTRDNNRYPDRCKKS